MVFSKEDKVLIKVLHSKRVMEQKSLWIEFLNKNCFVSSVKKLLTKINQTGTSCGSQTRQW